MKNDLNLNWHLLKDKEYPEPKRDILIYQKTSMNPWGIGGYFEFIVQVKLHVKRNGGRVWEGEMFTQDESSIVAWSYFDFPDFEGDSLSGPIQYDKGEDEQ